MKTLLLIISLLLLSGCSMKNLRTDFDNKYSTVIEKNYQQVYRDLIKRRENRSWSFMAFDKSVFEKDLYTDIKTAYIKTYIENPIGMRYMEFLIDIKYLEENKTNVTGYWIYPSWDHKGYDKIYTEYLNSLN